MNEAYLIERISYSGDIDKLVPWDAFQTRSKKALQRMIAKEAIPEIEWKYGLSYRVLSQFQEYDLWAIKNLGQISYERCLAEIKFLFEQLDLDPHFFDRITDTTEDIKSKRSRTVHDRSKKDRIAPPERDLYAEAKNLLDLQNAVIDTYHRTTEISERTFDILLGRNQAFANHIIPLEELGNRYGVTRERIRQIASKYENIREEDLRDSNSVIEATMVIISQSESYEDCLSSLQTTGLSAGAQIYLHNIYFISHVFCSDDYFAKISTIIDQAYERYNARQIQESNLQSQIKTFRNKLGIIDLNVACSDLCIDSESLRKLILDVYPRSIFIEGIALARTSNLDTAFENTLYKQLLISEDLTPENLIAGLERHASYRGARLPADNKAMSDLVINLTGEAPRLKVLAANMIEAPTLSEIDLWLRDLINDSPLGFLHRNDLMEAAMAEGFNYSSIGVYLLKNAIIRGHGEAIYSLVGTHVDALEVEAYAKMQRSNVERTIVDFRFEGSNIRLMVVPNINSISGVIFAPRALKEMLLGLEFESKCDCDKLKSEQRVKITKSNFLTGFTAMFKHGLTEHNLSLGTEFKFFIDFDHSAITLSGTDSTQVLS
jgi:hypothetical protein